MNAMLNAMEIRPAAPADFEAIWAIFEQVVAAGDTYTFAAGSDRETCRAYWFGSGVTSFVAVAHEAAHAQGQARVLGMYKLIANQTGRGAHVANASFMVDPNAHGRGIGKLMGQHCLDQARAAGYLAMQFNFVVSTNTGAVALWKKLGFEIIATVPKAYRHAQLGYVDAYVMYQLLRDPQSW